MSSLVSNILVFDSGVGGLSVYWEIRRLLPQHNYIYLFDNEAYPYGELSQERLLHRVESLVTSMVEEQDIDIVVIACNTASTIVLPMLRRKLSIPVVGVVPAIKPACNLAQKCVGLIATPATIRRPYTHELIQSFSSNKEVLLLGSTELVDMAEHKLRGEVVDLAAMADIFQPVAGKIDVAVLGCTHFPLLREEIQQVLGDEVILVDSGVAIAKRVCDLLLPSMQRHTQKENLIFSSALPSSERALNQRLKHWGFNQVDRFLHRDFWDR